MASIFTHGSHLTVPEGAFADSFRGGQTVSQNQSYTLEKQIMHYCMVLGAQGGQLPVSN